MAYSVFPGAYSSMSGLQQHLYSLLIPPLPLGLIIDDTSNIIRDGPDKNAPLSTTGLVSCPTSLLGHVDVLELGVGKSIIKGGRVSKTPLS